jgi:hypothetical protein
MTMEIDITTFFSEAEPWNFSASVAERGRNAGPETWNNAMEEGAKSPLLTTPEQIEALRDHVQGFGAWEREEIAAWTPVECNALFIQLVSGDMREGNLDNDPDDSDWADYERRAEAGNCRGRIWRGDDSKIYYYLGD